VDPVGIDLEEPDRLGGQQRLVGDEGVEGNPDEPGQLGEQLVDRRLRRRSMPMVMAALP
jgi:hypothetical protein